MLHKNGITIDPAKKTILHDGKLVVFRPLKKSSIRFDMACCLIISGPLTHAQLLSMLYDNHLDGGPLLGRRGIEVHLQHIKRKIKIVGLRIHRKPTGCDSGYFGKWIGP